MIQAQNVCLAFGKQIIFDHLSFIIQSKQRIGLVGANGSGKSTLLKAIMQQQYLDEGKITIMNGATIAYMPQEVVLNSPLSVFDEAFSSFAQLVKLQKTISQLEQRLHDNPGVAEIEEYASAQEQLHDFEPQKALAQTVAVLNGLGFSEQQQQSPVQTLSVGWKMRLVLAKLLLQKADFYLFDEPTNHLDIIAKDWFLEFLSTSQCGFLLVSHERYFLDSLCTEILELERGKATFYKGNYTAYVQQKEQRMIALNAAYEQQQREIEKTEQLIDRFRAKASKAGFAQSLIKKLDKMERIELPPNLKRVNFNFTNCQRSGRIVLTVENVSYRFGEKIIFEHINFEIERGEKVALIAPNGKGKTTLFNVIAGIYPLQEGSILFGHNVEYALFAQDQDAVLPSQSTIFDYVRQACPRKTENEIRSFLGSFLFSNDTIQKKLGVLSGGEKNRVSMVIALLQDANFLMLDEPTNHLDMQSKEVLLNALQQYNGTILFVSHDHDFINHIATRILELTHDGVISYAGTYADYLYHKKQKALAHAQKENGAQKMAQNEAIIQNNTSNRKLDNKESYELKKQLKKVEAAIDKTEKAIETAQHAFANIEYGSQEFAIQAAKLNTLRNELDQLMAEWENIQTKLG